MKFKKLLLAFVSLLGISALSGCNVNDIVDYSLYFKVDGQVYDVVKTTGNEIIKIPEDPTKEGYDFNGWFWDENVWKNPFTANSLLNAPISSNMSVYAYFILHHDHSYGPYVYDNSQHWKECECGHKINVENHNFGAWYTDNDNPTLKLRKCTICDYVETKQEGSGEKITVDTSKIVYVGTDVIYDGKPHFLSAVNVPSGISLTFTGDGQIDAGRYPVSVNFSYNPDVYNAIESQIVYLTISKKEINTSNVIFEDATINYDGALHSIKVQNLPSGISDDDVDYYYNNVKCDGVSEPGTYNVTAVFNLNDNYEHIPNLTATLTILRNDYSDDYNKYGVIGKTIDLINASSVSTMSGAGTVFKDSITFNELYREDLGEQQSTSNSFSSSKEMIEDTSAGFSAKIAFGSRTNKNGVFMTNKLPSFSISGSANYEKKKSTETHEYHYKYSFVMDGYRVEIKNYQTKDFEQYITDDLKNDALRIRNKTLSPEEFVSRWGTHVIMSAIFGEQIDVTYSAISNSASSSESLKADLDAEFSMRFLKTGLDISAHADYAKLTTSSSSSDIKSLKINAYSKKPFSCASLEEFDNSLSSWLSDNKMDDNSVFVDVPENSLFCVWYLLGDSFLDVREIMDNYMISKTLSLFQDKINSFNAFKLPDDLEFDYATGTLNVNLSNYQENGKINAFNGGIANGVLPLTPYYEGSKIQKIKINGSYGLKNINGQLINQFIYGFKIKLDKDWSDDLAVELHDCALITDVPHAIDRSSVLKNINISFTYFGNVIEMDLNNHQTSETKHCVRTPATIYSLTNQQIFGCELPFVTKTGYIFKSWVINNVNVDDNIVYTLDEINSIYVEWQAIKYTIEERCVRDGVYIDGEGSYSTAYYDETFTRVYGNGQSDPNASAVEWWFKSSDYNFIKWEYTDNGVKKTYDSSHVINLLNLTTKNNDTIVLLLYIESKGGGCLAPGTKITLGDGGYKNVEDVKQGDKLLVWNFNTGNFDVETVLFNDTDTFENCEVINLLFDDGTTTKVITEHGFFDLTKGEYVYLSTDASKYIGDDFVKIENEKLITHKLQSVTISKESLTVYSPVTRKQLCYFANDYLSMPGGINGLFNYFDVDLNNMKYDQDKMNSDIETYGLFSYEDFEDLITEEMFDALNIKYLKISIGKGLINLDYIYYLANRYSSYLI